MACRFEYKGKTYSQDELVGALKNMEPSEAAKYIPGIKSIPSAPFSKNWHELALKSALRDAAEGGYSRLSWTPGEAQAARYDLSKQVSALHINRDVANGNFHVEATTKQGSHADIAHNVPADKLADYVGKDLAQKIASDFQKPVPPMPTFTAEKVINKNRGTDHHVYADGKLFAEYGFRTPEESINRAEKVWQEQNGAGKRTYSGLDLKVGGEGMHGFYDQIIPKALEKIGKEYGVKVKQGTVPGANKVMQAGPQDWRVIGSDGRGLVEASGEPMSFVSKEAADKHASAGQPVHYIDIPEAMLAKLLGKGQPLFSGMAHAPSAAALSTARAQPFGSLAPKDQQ